MKYSNMAMLVCVAAITLFSTTLRSAESGSDPKAQVAKLQSEIETLKAEVEALKKENQSLRRIVAAGQQQQTTAAPAPVKQPASFIPDTPKAQQKATGYWMTTSSHKRHNSSCRYYMNSNGKPCGPTDGIPCKICGG